MHYEDAEPLVRDPARPGEGVALVRGRGNYRSAYTGRQSTLPGLDQREHATISNLATWKKLQKATATVAELNS